MGETNYGLPNNNNTFQRVKTSILIFPFSPSSSQLLFQVTNDIARAHTPQQQSERKVALLFVVKWSLQLCFVCLGNGNRPNSSSNNCRKRQDDENRIRWWCTRKRSSVFPTSNEDSLYINEIWPQFFVILACRWTTSVRPSSLAVHWFSSLVWVQNVCLWGRVKPGKIMT